MGRVKPEEIEQAIRPETILISVMHANNEVGALQPLEAIVHMAHDRGVVVHTDAAQTAGKIPTDAGLLGVDMLSIAGHKIYGPKGVGALFVRSGIVLEAIAPWRRTGARSKARDRKRAGSRRARSGL